MIFNTIVGDFKNVVFGLKTKVYWHMDFEKEMSYGSSVCLDYTLYCIVSVIIENSF